MDMEVSHFRLVSASDADTDDVFESSETEYKKQLNDALGATADANAEANANTNTYVYSSVRQHNRAKDRQMLLAPVATVSKRHADSCEPTADKQQLAS